MLNKPAIKKASVSEIEAAFVELAISRVSLYLDEPAKANNRKIDLLEAMGKELLRRHEEGRTAIGRLAVHLDPRVRVSIAPTVVQVDRQQGLALLNDLQSDPDLRVGLEARMQLDFDKYL
jgi:hypothetical protein